MYEYTHTNECPSISVYIRDKYLMDVQETILEPTLGHFLATTKEYQETLQLIQTHALWSKV